MPAPKRSQRDASRSKSSSAFVLVLLLILGGGALGICVIGSFFGIYYFAPAPSDPKPIVQRPEVKPPEKTETPTDDAKKVSGTKDAALDQKTKTDDAKVQDKSSKDISVPDNKKKDTIEKTKDDDKKKDGAPKDGDLDKKKTTQKPPLVGDPTYVPIEMRKLPAASEFGGLLAYYSFDDIEGETVKDLADEGTPGKLVGSPTIIDGVRGKAIRLDGSVKQYFDYAAHPKLNFAVGAPFTIALWSKAERDSGTLLSQRHTRPRDGDVIDVTLHQFKLRLELRDERHLPKNVTLNAGMMKRDLWHHITLTRNGDTVEFFLDGEGIGRGRSPAGTGAIATNLRALGQERFWLLPREGAFGNATFQGAFDEFCVYNRILTDNEIRALAGLAK